MKLKELAYNEYLEKYVDQEYKSDPVKGVQDLLYIHL